MKASKNTPSTRVKRLRSPELKVLRIQEGTAIVAFRFSIQKAVTA
jgi:hypothetical protein